jgi:chromosome segregation ATPase
MTDYEDDPKDERIFELTQEVNRLRGRITYLQEELASVEDELAAKVERYEDRIVELEQQLGDALYRD